MDSRRGNSGKDLDEMPPCSPDEEAPRRRSVAVMGSGRERFGVVFDGMPQTRSRSEFDAGVSLWAGLQPDILGVVLGFLPCLANRARVRSVCRHWRVSAQGHVLPPPLPILVLPEFRFSSLSDKGALMPVRRVPVPKEVAADDIRCVGSFDGWLVGVTPSKKRGDEYYRDADGDCFLVNVFSHKVIRLPELSNMRYNYSAYLRKTLSVINCSGDIHFFANDIYTLSLCQVVLSASPDSGSKYIVAAYSNYKCSSALALWQPGMTLWNVCSGVPIDGPKDFTFYQGKLYVLLRHRTRLFTCELEEDDRGFMVSRVELCLTELPHDHPYQEGGAISCNLVVWRGELLLIIRHYTDNFRNRKVVKVEVFELDVNTNPCGLTEIHSFNGDCILVGLGGCKPFPAGLHDGVEGSLFLESVFALDFSRNPYGVSKINNIGGDCIFVGSGGCKSFPASLHDIVEGDLIYFVLDYQSRYDRFVYNMRNSRMKPFAAKLLPCNFDVPEEIIDFPV